jgi:hypothetical protein
VEEISPLLRLLSYDVSTADVIWDNLPGKTGESHENPQDNQCPGEYPKELSPDTNQTQPPNYLT